MLVRVAHHVLQDDVRRGGLRNLDERLHEVVHLEVRGVRRLAQLAGQRAVEVRPSRGIGQVQATLDPVPEAAEVDVLDGALALAGPDERVLLRGPLEEADAAVRVLKLVHRGRVGTAEGACVVEPELGLNVLARRSHQLPRAELEAAQLDHVALRELVAGRGEVTDHEPQLLRATGGHALVDPEGAVLLDQLEELLRARRRGRRDRVTAEHLDVRAIAHKLRRPQHVERLGLEVVRLEVEEVVGVSRPRVGDDLNAGPHRRWDRCGPIHR
mmetsp:Transcript_3740/g.10827  ORF Transcript_3740/g.10827 Transcript_3740/m.10827 type:complete len:270 (+) Transcript_3740:586-1395(+)